jgi:Porin PorA
MSAQGGRRGTVVLVVGIVLIILGVVWSTVIFPSLSKVPTDLDKTLYFDGNFTVPDQTTGSMVTFPIEQILQQNGNGTQDGALFVHEKYTVRNAATGDDISAYYGMEQTLAVDRKTLEIVTSVDAQHRSGYWGPPRGLGKGDTFDLWNPGAYRALKATYVKDDTFRGLKVVIFQIDAKDISLGNDPQTQAPLLMDTVINLTIEPKTGVVADEDALTTTSLSMGGQKVPVVITYVRYAERTIVDLVDTAKDNQGKLFLAETVIPWVLGGVGAILVLIGLMLMTRKQKTTA